MAQIEERAVLLCGHATALADAVTDSQREEAARNVRWDAKALMALRAQRVRKATEDEEPEAGG